MSDCYDSNGCGGKCDECQIYLDTECVECATREEAIFGYKEARELWKELMKINHTKAYIPLSVDLIAAEFLRIRAEALKEAAERAIQCLCDHCKPRSDQIECRDQGPCEYGDELRAAILGERTKEEPRARSSTATSGSGR